MSYTGTRVLVTGGGGFIGSHLVEAVGGRGARVTALLHYNSRRDPGNLAFVDREVLAGVELAFGDVRDAALVRRLTTGQEVVFHLAALIGVPYSYDAPQSYVDTNVAGTLNVAQAALDVDVRRFVHVSTSECTAPPSTCRWMNGIRCRRSRLTPRRRSAARAWRSATRRPSGCRWRWCARSTPLVRVSAREILQLRSSPSNVPANVVGPAQSRWYPPRRDREQEEPLSKDLGGSRILVTGAGGFIGSHLTEALLHEGASVRALVHYDSRGDWARLTHLIDAPPRRLEVRAGDVRDPFLIESMVEGVDIVVHLAALVPIPYSYLAPAEFIDTNVRGTLHLLEAARRHGVRRFIQTSSSEVYGSARYTPIDEAHPLQAQSPYAASKIGADALAESYHRSFGMPVTILRPFNTYGPRQSARAFLPAVLAQAMTSDVVSVGALDPVRDMNFVEDTAAGFVAACRAPGIEGQVLHLGSGRGVSMRDLLEIAMKAAGKRPRLEIDLGRMRPPASEVRELVCDSSAARARLGWQPRVGLEEGVERTARWMADNLALYRPPFAPF